MNGEALFGAGGEPSDHQGDKALSAEGIELQRNLKKMAVADFARERLKRAKSATRRIGVAALPTSSAALP